MIVMKQAKFFFFSLVLIFLLRNFAFGSHFAGGDISVVYTGTPNMFQVTLSLYRDCSGAPAPLSPAIILDNDCGVSGDIELPSLALVQEVSAIDFANCPSLSTCQGGQLPGMQMYQFQTIIEMTPCDSWTLSFQSGARNSNLNVSSGTFYIETIINTLASPTNTAPTVTWTPSNGFDPIPYGCAGFVKNYALNVAEPDGDSVVYSFSSALGNGGQPVSYIAPATGTAPIPGITINPQTGVMSFNAAQPGNYVITVLIEEYNSAGVLISSVLHDFLYVVEVCTSTSGVVAPINVLTFDNNFTNAIYDSLSNTISMCIGDEFCFDAIFFNASGDSIILESDVANVLPNASFQYYHISKDSAVATVCWEYQPGYSSNEISIIAKDVACTPTTSIYSVNLNIPPNLNVSFDQQICGNQTANLSATGQGPLTWSVISGEPIIIGSNFSCNPCNQPIASPSITTTYLVEDNSNCNLTDSVLVEVADNWGGINVGILTEDTLICPGECVDVEGFATEEQNIPVMAGPWTFGQFADETVQINSVMDVPTPVAVAQMAPFTTIQPNMICEVCVDIEHPSVGDLRLELVAPNGATFMLADQNGGGGADYLNTCFTMTHPNGLPLQSVSNGFAPFPGPHAPIGNMNTALIGAPIATTSTGAWRLRVSNFGNTAPALVDSWSIKFCKDSIYEFPTAFFAWDNQDGMPQPPNDTVQPTVCPQNGGLYVLSAFNIDLCFANDSININLHPLPDAGIDATGEVCIDDGVVDLITFLGGNPHPVGTWQDGNGNPMNQNIDAANISSLAQPFLYIAESVDGCLDSAELNMTVIEVVIDNITTEMPACFGNSDGEITVTASSATGINAGSLTYSISTGGPAQTSNVFTGLPDGTYDVTAIYTIPTGGQCTETQTSIVLVEPGLLQINSITVNGLSPSATHPDITTVNTPLEVKSCDYKTMPLSANSQGGNPAATHQYEWYLDNNFVGQGAVFESVFNPTGPGYVVLSDGVCPNDTAFLFVHHYDNVFPSFSSDLAEGCVELEVQFTDNSTEVPGGDNGYQDIRLTFSNGDAIPPIGKNGTGSYTFKEAGTYDVTIDITSVNNYTTGSTRALHECRYDTTYFNYIEAFPLPLVKFIPAPTQVTVYEPSTMMQNLSPTGGNFRCHNI